MLKISMFINLFTIIVATLVIADNFRLENIRNKDAKEIGELVDLATALSKENQGYRKVIEKWELEQDEKNKNYWGM